LPAKNPRRGNGAGWGGPAKGASVAAESIQTAAPFAAENQPSPEAKRAGQLKAIADRDEILEKYTAILRNPDETTQNIMSAGDRILNRTEGTPVARQELTGADGGPLASEIVYRWADDPEKE